MKTISAAAICLLAFSGIAVNAQGGPSPAAALIDPVRGQPVSSVVDSGMATETITAGSLFIPVTRATRRPLNRVIRGENHDKA